MSSAEWHRQPLARSLPEPGKRLAELVRASNGLLEIFRTYVPIVGEPKAPGTPGPAWIFDLAFAIERLARVLDAIHLNEDYFDDVFKKRRLIHGIQWMINLTNSLLARWEWPLLEDAEDWWLRFFDAQWFTSDDQVRMTASAWPTLVHLNVVADGKGGHRTEIVGAEHIIPKGPLRKATIPLDHMGLVIYELTRPGGQTRFLVAFKHGSADRMPTAFLLTDPILPTIRVEELAAMQAAMEMIVAGAQSEPDALIGSELDRTEPVRLVAPNHQASPPSSETESPPTPTERSSGNEAKADEADDYVTLDQAAGMVHKCKRTLERYKTNGTLPEPTFEGGGGRASLYAWKTMGPWLEGTFGINQPDRFPASRRN